MLASLFLHGIFVVGFIFFFGRWLDDEITADVCLFGLVFELIYALMLTRYTQITDCVLYVQVGVSFNRMLSPESSLVFCFDEVSGLFFSILTFALIVCFFFLVEYFEYDSNAGSIIFLSALFSQLALMYFCSFDLYSLLFF